ncbi:MAG: Smr/MutS family protein [Novosphingobium sp.]
MPSPKQAKASPSTTRFAGGPPPRDKLGEDLKKSRPLANRTLDGTWDRKLSGGTIQPDFTLDLHGHTLDSAHARLDHGLTQALAQGARVLLLITGKSRPSDDHASRGERRGAIRAKVLDWLALGPHASKIAAVRQAHPRHGGAGALYIVLKRPR